MFNNMLHPLLQQMFKMASFCMNTSQEISIVSIRQLHHQQLSAICQTRSHTDTAVVVQILKKSFKVVLYLFVANSFTSLLALKLLNFYRLKK